MTFYKMKFVIQIKGILLNMRVIFLSFTSIFEHDLHRVRFINQF